MGSVELGAGQVRTGHTVVALVSDEELARLMRDVSKEFQKIPPEALRTEFAAIVAESVGARTGAVPPAEPDGGAPARPGGKTPNLDQYTVNLTERARRAARSTRCWGATSRCGRSWTSSPAGGRTIPILVGEAGVGKTAVVEGFAVRIASGDVPPPLKNVTLRTLDLALLQAGAGVKGEFENRLKGLIEEVKRSARRRSSCSSTRRTR